MTGEENVPTTSEHVVTGLRRKVTRVWRRQLAKLLHRTYRVQHAAEQYRARYGKYLGAGIVVCLLGANAVFLPQLQAYLEAWFPVEEDVQTIESLLLNIGSALIGATAIVTSLVLFAMQVNVERLPHGLFRHFSEDPKLLGSFASAFVLAIRVAAMSTVADRPTIAAVVVSAFWAILFVLALFLYAYRRALGLINPSVQLQILLGDARKDLRRWSRRADRTTPLMERDEDEDGASRGSRPEARRRSDRLLPAEPAVDNRRQQVSPAFDVVRAAVRGAVRFRGGRSRPRCRPRD